MISFEKTNWMYIEKEKDNDRFIESNRDINIENKLSTKEKKFLIKLNRERKKRKEDMQNYTIFDYSLREIIQEWLHAHIDLIQDIYQLIINNQFSIENIYLLFISNGRILYIGITLIIISYIIYHK